MASLKETRLDEKFVKDDDEEAVVIDEKTEELKYLLESCMEKLDEAEVSLANIAEIESRVNEKGFQVQSEIKRTAENMIETIQQRKCEMSAQVKSAMKAKQKALNSQKTKLGSYVESLKSSIEYSNDILNNNDNDASQWKPALIEFLKEIVDEQVDHEPAADEGFELTVNEEEYMFDLEEFFTRLCTRRRSHLSSNGTS
jgi:predicted translin family RNA/ssDNA-binding protein